MANTRQSPAAMDYLGAAFANAEGSALKLVTRLRLIAMCILSVYLFFQVPGLVGLYWAILTISFGIMGLIYYGIARSRHHAEWHKYLFAFFDAAFLAFALTYPNPFLPWSGPLPLQLRFENFLYFFVFLALTALTYSPRLVLWVGLATALCWTGAVVRIIALPDTVTMLGLPNAYGEPTPEKTARMLDANYVSISNLVSDVVLILIVATILATAVRRSMGLVRRQVRSERARANLSRYFSPNMIEELSQMDDPLGAVRAQNVGVLFADIVGFTSLSERQSPEWVIALLREFHSRMAREVFAHNGTVDKYIGDGIMATFGTPHAGTKDAINAVRCAEAMLRSVDEWNVARTAASDEPVKVAVGLHYGPVVLGDIGDERRLEFAVVGDTVNVASRLESLTRHSGVPVLISEDTVRAAQRQAETADNGSSTDPLPGLKRARKQTVRGRKEAVGTWTLSAT